MIRALEARGLGRGGLLARARQPPGDRALLHPPGGPPARRARLAHRLLARRRSGVQRRAAARTTLAGSTCRTSRRRRWSSKRRGVAGRPARPNALQATLQVAIPELEGATNRTVFAGQAPRRRWEPGAASRRWPSVWSGSPSASPARPPWVNRGGAAASRSCCSASRLTLATRARRPTSTSSPSLHPCSDALRTAGYTVAAPAAADGCAARSWGRGARLAGQRARGGPDRCPRAPRAAPRTGERAIMGTGTGSPAQRRQRRCSCWARVRQRLCRRAAGVRLRGQPDAAALRARLCPDPRFSAFYRWIRNNFGPMSCCISARAARSSSCPGKQTGLDGTRAGRSG